MRRKRNAIVLTLAALGIVGCAQSDRRLSQPGQPGWRPVSTDRSKGRSGKLPTDNADVEPPRILPETHFAAGRLFESRGQLARATHQYRRATAVNHAYADAYHRLGVLLSMTGQQEEALEALRRAVQLKPNQPVFRNDLGFVLVMNRRWDEAEQEFLRVIDVSPAFARAYVNLGIVQSKLGRWEEARASFGTVLPEPDTYYNMGLMYRSQHRYEEAREAFEQARNLDPTFTAAATQLAKLRLRDEGPSRHEDEVPRELIGPAHVTPATGETPTTSTWTVQDIRGRAAVSTGVNHADRTPSSPTDGEVGPTPVATPTTPPTGGIASVPDRPDIETHVGESSESPAPQRPESGGARAATGSLVDETTLSLHALAAIDPRADLGTLTSIVDNEIECMKDGRALAFGRSSGVPSGAMGESTLDGQIILYDTQRAEAAFGGDSNNAETNEEPCVETLIIFEDVPSPTPSEPGMIAATFSQEEPHGITPARTAGTMACTVDPVDEWFTPWHMTVPIASPYDGAARPVRETDGMGEQAFSPWTGRAHDTGMPLTAADRTAKLRQLADRLEIVRNEIACLEELNENQVAANAAIRSLDVGTTAQTPLTDVKEESFVGSPTQAGRPRDFITMPTKRATLAAKVIEPNAVKATPTKKPRPKSHAVQPTDDRKRSKGGKPAAGRKDQRRKPNDLPIA